MTGGQYETSQLAVSILEAIAASQAVRAVRSDYVRKWVHGRRSMGLAPPPGEMRAICGEFAREADFCSPNRVVCLKAAARPRVSSAGYRGGAGS